jgi:V/A-type H+-transporting ATPase subunit E
VTEKTIYEKIEELGNEELAQIKIDTLELCENTYKEIISKANLEAERIVKEANFKASQIKTQQEHNSNLERRQTKGKIYEQVVEEVFSKVLEHYNNLEGTKLLNLVASLLSNEEVDKNAKIEVSKKDYNKYLNALSSNKKDLDLLNKKLGNKYNLELSKDPANIENGFIVIGSIYDLNFNFTDLVNLKKEELQRDLIKHLFEE